MGFQLPNPPTPAPPPPFVLTNALLGQNLQFSVVGGNGPVVVSSGLSTVVTGVSGNNMPNPAANGTLAKIYGYTSYNTTVPWGVQTVSHANPFYDNTSFYAEVLLGDRFPAGNISDNYGFGFMTGVPGTPWESVSTFAFGLVNKIGVSNLRLVRRENSVTVSDIDTGVPNSIFSTSGALLSISSINNNITFRVLSLNTNRTLSPVASFVMTGFVWPTMDAMRLTVGGAAASLTGTSMCMVALTGSLKIYSV